jgi:hypothetical protein
MRLNKYLFFIVALVLMVIQALSAQVPAGFNYQAAARHSDGSLMVNDQIEVRFTLYDGNTQVWQETYSRQTDNYGLFNIVIGENSPQFEAISWDSGDFSMKVEIDAGSGFQNLGFQDFFSVPYALRAKDVDDKDDADADPQNEIQTLSLSGNDLTLSNNGGVVTLPSGNIEAYTSIPAAGFGTTTTVDVATVTFTLGQESKVLVLADVNAWGGGPCEDTFRLEFDGVPENRTAVHIDNQAPIGGNNGASVHTSWMTTLPAGSHTVKLRAWGGCAFYKHPHLHVIVLGN